MVTGEPWNFEKMKQHLEVSSVYGRPYAVIGHNGGTPEVVDACPENEPYNEVYFVSKDDYARLLAKKEQCKILAQIIADHEAEDKETARIWFKKGLEAMGFDARLNNNFDKWFEEEWSKY